MTRTMGFCQGMLIGLGIMYVLDPDRGRVRRARLRDQVSGAFDDASSFLGSARHRDDDAPVGTDHANGATLADRVRAKLGRYVSHPRAVLVEAEEGRVVLRGPILRHEVEDLIGGVSSVRGVTEVVNRLEPHDASDHVPGLESSGHPVARWGPGLQLIAGVLGATAVAYGARRIASRLREAASDAELEREMPEYAMLR